MSDPVTQAQPPLEFIEPDYNPWILRLARSLLPFWMRWRAGISQVDVQNAAALAELYHQFQAGKMRIMLAFRHPSANDPYCLADLLWRQIPKIAKQQGIPLHLPVHAHFLYDRGIPLWAGQWVGWIYAKLGGTPIRRGKVDLAGLRSARALFAKGQFPLAAAPEGATNGHNEIISPIEPGIAQFGFWCIEDLKKANRNEDVLIVPIGIQYRFVEPPWGRIAQLLHQLEQESGLSETALPESAPSDSFQDGITPTPAQEAMLYQRLFRLGEYLLALMETFYTQFYYQDLSKLPEPGFEQQAAIAHPSPEQSMTEANQRLANRLQALLNAALNVAEQYFNLKPKGNVTDRCRRLEQVAWDRIYREDLKLETLSPVQQGLADRIAEEASLRIWHMRLVETFVSVTGHYVLEKPTVERFADTLLLLWDTVTRLKGKDPFPRPRLGEQRVQMTIGEPISVSNRWEAYQGNRRRTVSDLTQDLQTALEKMII